MEQQEHWKTWDTVNFVRRAWGNRKEKCQRKNKLWTVNYMQTRVERETTFYVAPTFPHANGSFFYYFFFRKKEDACPNESHPTHPDVWPI